MFSGDLPEHDFCGRTLHKIGLQRDPSDMPGDFDLETYRPTT